MLDFCAGQGVAADIELIPIQQINAAFERLLKWDVKHRFVIDVGATSSCSTERTSTGPFGRTTRICWLWWRRNSNPSWL